MQALFIDHPVELARIGSAPAFFPAEWKSELETPFGRAVSSLVSEIAEGTNTPWIISSGKVDLTGRSREESASHLSGHAFDIAPMYSQDVILPEDPALSNLAANWIFLSILSPYLLKFPGFIGVEGDHVHVTDVEKPSALETLVLAVTTVSTAYKLSAVYAKPDALVYDPVARLLGPAVECVQAQQILQEAAANQENQIFVNFN